MIDMWTICWRAHEEMYRNGAMINFYQLKTNANVQLTIRATSDALSRGHNVSWNEPATGPLGVNISASRLKLHFQKFGNVIWGYYFFTKPYKYFISFHLNFWASSKLILTFTKWGGVACKTTSVHGPQCNFRPRNTSSVHGRQLPSTSAPPRYLIHCFPHEWAKNESMLRADNKTIRNGLNHIPALKQKLFRDIVLKNYESVKFFTGFPELWSV